MSSQGRSGGRGGSGSSGSNNKSRPGNKSGYNGKHRSFPNEQRNDEDKARQVSSPENHEASGSQSPGFHNSSGNKSKHNYQPQPRAFTISKNSTAEKESDQKLSPKDEIRERVKGSMSSIQGMRSADSTLEKVDTDASDAENLSNSDSASKPQSIKSGSGTFECSTIPHKSRHSGLKNAEGCDERRGKQKKDRNSRGKSCITEVESNIFNAPDDVSLVHCVGADLRMGSGIAVRFLEQFKSLGELFDQREGPGGVAYIRSGQRHVFYLITKQASTDKPTLDTMKKSLLALREKCKKLDVTKLAMPQIGCGLDELSWSDVKQMIEEIFADGFTITIYKLDRGFVDKPQRGSKATVKNENLLLKDIASDTGLLYIGSVKPFVTAEMQSLNEKYPFLPYIKRSYTLGTAGHTRLSTNDVVYGLICRKYPNGPLSYKHLEAAIEDLKRYNKQHRYEFFGLQAFVEKDDPYVMEKIETLFKNSFIDAEFWICWPPSLIHMRPLSSKRNAEAMQVQESSPIGRRQSSRWDDTQENHQTQDHGVREVEEKMNAQSLANESESGTSTYDPNVSEAAIDALDNLAAMEWTDDKLMADLPEPADSSHDNEADGSWENYADDERRRSNEKKKAIQLDKEKERQEKKAVKPESCVTECKGDLFDAEDTMCLAHCVGADFRMGSGIAVLFRQKFGSVDELLDQRVDQGGVAVLTREKRHIFYLVTKRESTGKPTLRTLEKSLHALHEKCKELNVTQLAMPRIGCGLDRLEWDDVKKMLERIFADGFSIKIYNLAKPEFGSTTFSGGRNSWGEPDNQRMFSMLRDMQRTQESTYRKLTTLDDIKDVIFNPDGLKAIGEQTTTRMTEFATDLGKLSVTTNGLFQELKSFAEFHDSLLERMKALENTNQELHERLELLEQRLSAPYSSTGPSSNINGGYSHSGHPGRPFPLHNQPVQQMSYLSVDIAGRSMRYPPPRYATNHHQIYASEVLPAEKDALTRAANEFAEQNHYELVVNSSGLMWMRKDPRHAWVHISSHGDLNSISSSRA